MNKKTKKLALSSETLRNLDDIGLTQAQGAATDATGACTYCTLNCTICTIHCRSACCP